MKGQFISAPVMLIHPGHGNWGCTWVRRVQSQAQGLHKWLGTRCRLEGEMKGHLSTGRSLWRGGQWRRRWLPQCLWPQGFKQTASLRLWGCPVAVLLPFPTPYWPPPPASGCGCITHNPLAFTVLPLISLACVLDNELVCYSFWATQLLQKWSNLWFAWFVSCPSSTASPLWVLWVIGIQFPASRNAENSPGSNMH